ncbi:hypothetical protein [Enterocloster citroniae]|uniref:Uncharacterized protein n=1 Tax=[Clostridium] citroniae WAL-17108 TaxID=742733 RepID=G5HTL6_9FIRM|nr:hypothetical protein [Enterocloster citroniae]EHE95179.1 hypothetical protein HMPREF9469_05928 [ [[Clostridium] citroniae WAL-17108]MCC3388084.1 hypothetical protein [Enterocloster citroniae]
MEESDFYTLENTDRVGIFLICIKNKQGELSGDIVNFYLKEPVAFTGILDLGLKIDTLCAKFQRPMATTEPRFLTAYMKRAYEKRELDKEHIPLKYCTKIQNMDRFMALGISTSETLVIEIHQRQFSSMQGRIKGKCSEGNYISFRSALELMRMLREYEYARNAQAGKRKRGRTAGK